MPKFNEMLVSVVMKLPVDNSFTAFLSIPYMIKPELELSLANLEIDSTALAVLLPIIALVNCVNLNGIPDCEPIILNVKLSRIISLVIPTN